MTTYITHINGVKHKIKSTMDVLDKIELLNFDSDYFQDKWGKFNNMHDRIDEALSEHFYRIVME